MIITKYRQYIECWLSISVILLNIKYINFGFEHFHSWFESSSAIFPPNTTVGLLHYKIKSLTFFFSKTWTVNCCEISHIVKKLTKLESWVAIRTQDKIIYKWLKYRMNKIWKLYIYIYNFRRFPIDGFSGKWWSK